MSVLIKGMDVPKQGYIDVRLFSDGRATTAIAEHPFYRELDIVEVPTPHGRLIDVDDVLTQKIDTAIESETSWGLGKLYGWNLAIEYIDREAPTVIEAED